jgi:hypothetical protein
MALMITNRTAFPLNVALIQLSPLQHMNAIEPGCTWITEPPSPFFVPSALASASRFESLLPKLHPLRTSSERSDTRIQVLFDRGHNRFDSEAASELWLSMVLRRLAMLAMFISFTAVASAQICRLFWHTSGHCQLALNIFGAIFFLASAAASYISYQSECEILAPFMIYLTAFSRPNIIPVSDKHSRTYSQNSALHTRSHPYASTSRAVNAHHIHPNTITYSHLGISSVVFTGLPSAAIGCHLVRWTCSTLGRRPGTGD